MKKSLAFILTVVLLAGAAAIWAAGDSGEDYKVIKNAVNKNGGSVSLFRVTIKDKKNQKESVSIKFPLAIAELIASCENEAVNDIVKDAVKDVSDVKKHCNLDLKKMLRVLRESGPMTLVELDSEDALIKIWLE